MNKIKQTWTWNHKLLIVTIALTVAHITPLVPLPTLPTLQANTVTYTASSTAPYTIESELLARTITLYESNKANDLERYRLQAIQELNQELQVMVFTSPHVDYDAMRDEYGY